MRVLDTATINQRTVVNKCYLVIKYYQFSNKILDKLDYFSNESRQL